MEIPELYYASSYPSNLCGLNENDFIYPWPDGSEELQCPDGKDEENITEFYQYDMGEDVEGRRRSVSMTVVETAREICCPEDSSDLALDALSNRGTSHLHGFLAQRRTRPKAMFGNVPRSRTSSFGGEHLNSPHSRARKISFRVKRGTPMTAVRKAPILPFGMSNEPLDSSEVSYGRRNSISAGAGMKRSTRRCSEPFLFNAPLSSKLKKQSVSGSRPPYSSRRRLSTTAALLPATSKHKLQALAKDELLASLNLPLDVSDQNGVSSIKGESKVSAKTTVEEEDQRCEEKRIKVIEEILETEKKYLSCLTTLDQVFRRPMLEGAIVPEKDIKLIFPPVLNNLQECHCWFMKELEERISSSNWRGMVGDTFAKLSDSSTDNLLEMYTGYVNAFPKSVSTLSRYTRTSQKFRRFLEMCAENPQCDSLELTSFLLTPVQRLPRYVLLLRQLLKFTGLSHLDHAYVCEALQKMEALIESLNGSIQNSMQVYSAGESERRKMIRRQLSRRRKKTKPAPIEIRCQNNVIGRPLTTSPLTPTTENGPESPLSAGVTSTNVSSNFHVLRRGMSEDARYETEGLLNRRSSSTPDVVSSSDAASRTSSNDADSAVSFRHRNGELRKSWRRSFGAMFSSMWSGKDDKDFETDDKLASPSIEASRQETSDPHTSKRHSVGHGPMSKGFARRKYGVAYPMDPGTAPALDEYVDKEEDLEMNNNDCRRKTSTSSRDKKRSSWLLMNGWKRNMTPPTSDEELSSSVEQGSTKHKTSLTRSTSSSVISDREQFSSELNAQGSPTMHRTTKTRHSGRSTGLSSFFHKAKQRQDIVEMNNQGPLSHSNGILSHTIQENVEGHVSHGKTLHSIPVSKTVSVDRNTNLGRSPSMTRKVGSKTRRRSAPVQVVEVESQLPHKNGLMPMKSVPIKGRENSSVKGTVTPKDSKGKFRKALKQIVGRTKN